MQPKKSITENSRVPLFARNKPKINGLIRGHPQLTTTAVNCVSDWSFGHVMGDHIAGRSIPKGHCFPSTYQSGKHDMSGFRPH